MLQNVIQIAQEAGNRILKYYDQEVSIESKQDNSPLTQADLASNSWIVSELEKLTPQIPLISEEIAIPEYDTRKKWNRYWLIDPLDGTKEFIKKNGEFTVNIALIENNEPTLGVIYAPALSQLYYAQNHKGAWKSTNGANPVQIFSNPLDLTQPQIIVESRSHQATSNSLELPHFEIKQRLSIGSSLKFCLLAEGKADLYIRQVPCMEWDVAAGDCIFKNSGRNALRGSDLKYNKPNLRNDSFVIGLK